MHKRRDEKAEHERFPPNWTVPEMDFKKSLSQRVSPCPLHLGKGVLFRPFFLFSLNFQKNVQIEGRCVCTRFGELECCYELAVTTHQNQNIE